MPGNTARRRTADGVTPKQARFVAEYLIDLNATQAAIRAGYSAKTADVQGPRLLGNAGVQSAISGAMKRRERRTEITQERVLAELAKIGFSDIRKAVKWGEGIAVPTEDGGEPVVIMNGIALVGSEQIDDDTAAAIAEISQTAQGLKVKLHDKRAALVDLGRHLGAFKDRVEHSGPNGEPIQHEVGDAKALLESRLATMNRTTPAK